MSSESKEPEKLVSLLKAAGITLTDIARTLGKRNSTVSDWKHGNHVPKLSPTEYADLLNLLGCTPDDLKAAFPDKKKTQPKPRQSE